MEVDPLTPEALAELREIAGRDWSGDEERTVSCFMAEHLSRMLDAVEERAGLRSRLDLAGDLLKRVVIQGGAQSWTGKEMHDWCCDYKDFSNGHDAEWVKRGHANCGHRSREASNDEPVPCYDLRCGQERDRLLGLLEEYAEAVREAWALDPEAPVNPNDIGNLVMAMQHESEARCVAAQESVDQARAALRDLVRESEDVVEEWSVMSERELGSAVTPDLRREFKAVLKAAQAQVAIPDAISPTATLPERVALLVEQLAAEKAIGMPSREEVEQWRTPERAAQTAAIREVVLNPGLVAQLREQLERVDEERKLRGQGVVELTQELAAEKARREEVERECDELRAEVYELKREAEFDAQCATTVSVELLRTREERDGLRDKLDSTTKWINEFDPAARLAAAERVVEAVKEWSSNGMPGGDYEYVHKAGAVVRISGPGATLFVRTVLKAYDEAKKG